MHSPQPAPLVKLAAASCSLQIRRLNGSERVSTQIAAKLKPAGQRCICAGVAHHAPWRPTDAPKSLPCTKAGSARRLIVWQALYRLEPLALLIHQRHQADWNLQREASHSSAADCSLSLIQTALMEALHPGAYLEYHAAELGDIVEPLLWRLFSLPVACMQGS